MITEKKRISLKKHFPIGHSFSVFFLAQVFSAEGKLHHLVDVSDPIFSNWMCYVNPAPTYHAQNLMACQQNLEIFFYTITPILPGMELLVCPTHGESRHLQYLFPRELTPEPGENVIILYRSALANILKNKNSGENGLVPYPLENLSIYYSS